MCVCAGSLSQGTLVPARPRLSEACAGSVSKRLRHAFRTTQTETNQLVSRSLARSLSRSVSPSVRQSFKPSIRQQRQADRRSLDCRDAGVDRSCGLGGWRLSSSSSSRQSSRRRRRRRRHLSEWTMLCQRTRAESNPRPQPDQTQAERKMDDRSDAMNRAALGIGNTHSSVFFLQRIPRLLSNRFRQRKRNASLNFRVSRLTLPLENCFELATEKLSERRPENS